MGLINSISSGLAEMGAATEKIGLAQMQSAIEEQRAMRLAELQSQVKLRDEQTIRDRNESERASQAGRVGARAEELAAARRVTPPVVEAQADAAATAYNAADLSPVDKQLGLDAVNRYVRENQTVGAPVTADDRTRAAIELGQISPYQAALLDQRSEHDAAYLQRVEDAARLGQERIDASERNAATRANAQRDAAAARGVPTLTQRARNLEIDAARKHIAGMDPEQIKRATQQYTATGRENPDYDPQLASRVRRAYQRKVGDDPWFDATLDDGADIDTLIGANGPRGNDSVLKDFMRDPAMRGRKLGKRTEQGFEVLDANGKLIGHYQ